MRKGLRKWAATLLFSVLLVPTGAALAACSPEPEDPSKPGEYDPNATYYTVTLDPNGGAFSDGTTEKKEIQVKEKDKIDFSAYEVFYEGNEMYGWYYTDGSPFPAARKITENITIKAKWSVAEEKQEVGLTLIDYVNTVLSVDYEDGVYQFYKNSPIYGGYAQRGGKYTVYEDELKAALAANAGSEKAVCVYTAKSNYRDTTGGCYAEFFNDGSIELIYDYTYGTERTKYTMEVLAYTIEGVTMPFTTPALPDISGSAMDDNGNYNASALASKSVHYADNAAALIGGPGTLENPFEDDEPEEPGDVVLSAKAEVDDESVFVRYAANNGSTTMFLQFNRDGTFACLFDTSAYGVVGFHTTGSGTWTIAGGELIMEGYGSLTTEDGVCVFDDGGGNTYAFASSDFIPVLSEIVDVDDDTVFVRYAANNGSTTMFLQFNRDGSYTVKMNYGNYGLVDIGVKGTWTIADGALALVGGGTMTEQFGVYTFEDGNGNTFAFTVFDAE